MNVIKTVFGSAIEKGLDVVDQFVEDKDQRAQLKQAMRMRMQETADSALQEQSAIIQAEASGESWLQRNWRPILMLVIVAIVANNYLLAPYLGAVFGVGLSLDLPPRLWDLMTIGVGGYITVQGGERITQAVQSRKAAKDARRK